jgi:small subunit ribosomal protein S17
MFRRKKKEEQTEQPQSPAPAPETASAETEKAEPAAAQSESVGETAAEPVTSTAEVAAASSDRPASDRAAAKSGRGNRVQKVGIVASDKMQKTVVVRVDRQVLHMKYRRYVRRTTRFKAHDELGATVGDRVRIVETRPLSAQKRWRVVEILQKAAK